MCALQCVRVLVDAQNVFRHVLHCCALQDGAWRVGEGVCCLTTPTHTYIARVKPSSGDLVMLFSIPQPHPGTQQQAVPVAAWLPHSRYAARLVHQAVCKDSPGAVLCSSRLSASTRPANPPKAGAGHRAVSNTPKACCRREGPAPHAAGCCAGWSRYPLPPPSLRLRCDCRQKTGGHSRVSGDTLMPVGVLALGWGSRLVLFEVPLVGDQITAGEVAAGEQTGSVNRSVVAAAASTAECHGVHTAHNTRVTAQVHVTLHCCMPMTLCAACCPVT